MNPEFACELLELYTSVELLKFTLHVYMYYQNFWYNQIVISLNHPVTLLEGQFNSSLSRGTPSDQ